MHLRLFSVVVSLNPLFVMVRASFKVAIERCLSKSDGAASLVAKTVV